MLRLTRFLLIALAFAAVVLVAPASASTEANIVRTINEHKWLTTSPPVKVQPTANKNGRVGGKFGPANTAVAPEIKQVISSLAQDATGSLFNRVKVQFNANYPKAQNNNQNNNMNFGKNYQLIISPAPFGSAPIVSKDGDDIEFTGLANGQYQFSIKNNKNGLVSPLSPLITLSGATATSPLTVSTIDAALQAQLTQALTANAAGNFPVGTSLTNPAAVPQISSVTPTPVNNNGQTTYNLAVVFTSVAPPAGFFQAVYSVILNNGVVVRGPSSPLTVTNVQPGTYALTVTDWTWQVNSKPTEVVVGSTTAPVTPATGILGTIPAVTSATTPVPFGQTQVAFNGVVGAISYTVFASVPGSNQATAVATGASSPVTFPQALPVGTYNIVVQAVMPGNVGGTVSAQFTFVQVQPSAQPTPFTTPQAPFTVPVAPPTFNKALFNNANANAQKQKKNKQKKNRRNEEAFASIDAAEDQDAQEFASTMEQEEEFEVAEVPQSSVPESTEQKEEEFLAQLLKVVRELESSVSKPESVEAEQEPEQEEQRPRRHFPRRHHRVTRREREEESREEF